MGNLTAKLIATTRKMGKYSIPVHLIKVNGVFPPRHPVFMSSLQLSHFGALLTQLDADVNYNGFDCWFPEMTCADGNGRCLNDVCNPTKIFKLGTHAVTKAGTKFASLRWCCWIAQANDG